MIIRFKKKYKNINIIYKISEMKPNIIKCEKCEKVFTRKRELILHTKSGKNCISLGGIELPEIEEIICITCGAKYTTKFSLERHLANTNSKCYKDKTGLMINNGQIHNNKVANYITNNTTNVTNNMNQNFIQPVVNNLHQHKHFTIAKHGEEITSHFTEEVLLRILNIESFTECCAEFMRVLYFNKEVPENQNWSIVYPRNKKAGVTLNLETNKFERVETNDIIDSKFSNMAFLLFPKALKLLERHFIEPFLTKTQVYNINKLGMHFGMMNISKTSKEVYKAIHKMAYEARQEQMDTWREGGHKGNHLSLKF